MCACVHACMRVCVCVCTCVCVYMCVCVHVCACACVCMHMWVCVCTCVSVCVFPVQQMMQNNTAIALTPQAMADLQALCSALLDSVNDKTLALSHQRKANK